LFEVALLWLSILMLIIMTRRYAPSAALLFIPYLIWVTIAAALNYQVVMLNRPFA
jgi:translocator protein